MLWDLIRDFFVMHVFGGTLINADTGSTIYYSGYLGYDIGSYGSMADTTNVIAPLGFLFDDGSQLSLSIGDYLSTTATIISITIIVVLCCLFVYKIIKLIGGLIR